MLEKHFEHWKEEQVATIASAMATAIQAVLWGVATEIQPVSTTPWQVVEITGGDP